MPMPKPQAINKGDCGWCGSVAMAGPFNIEGYDSSWVLCDYCADELDAIWPDLDNVVALILDRPHTIKIVAGHEEFDGFPEGTVNVDVDEVESALDPIRGVPHPVAVSVGGNVVARYPDGTLETIDRDHGYAVCECENCGRRFLTTLTEDDKLRYDGVRNHGRKYGDDEDHQPSWNYKAIDRHPDTDKSTYGRMYIPSLHRGVTP